MTVYSGLPLFYRYVQNLNQEISGVPTGTPDALFFPGTGEVSFVSTYTAEQWRKIFDCILFGADFLYPDESHDIMFSWLKQVEWPTLPETCEGDSMLMYVPLTTVSSTGWITIPNIPQNYTHMRLDFAFETDRAADTDNLIIRVYPSHSYLYNTSGTWRDDSGAWAYYSEDKLDLGFRFQKVLAGQNPTIPVAPAGHIIFPFYTHQHEDWKTQCYGMGNVLQGEGHLGNWQASGELTGSFPVDMITLQPSVGTVLADGVYSLSLWGKTD